MKFVDGWYIPDQDAAIRVHPVRHQMAKDIRVIDVALKYIVGRDCVIQAGARVGLWPKTLAKHFRKVVCFEPETRNCECAIKNLADCDNVDLYKAALGEARQAAWVEFSSDKSGSHWLASQMPDQGEPCEVWTIDGLELSPDAIFLDIEGCELSALEGARDTIATCKPVLVLEENRSRERYGVRKGELATWLSRFGYVVADRVGKDLLFVA